MTLAAFSLETVAPLVFARNFMLRGRSAVRTPEVAVLFGTLSPLVVEAEVDFSGRLLKLCSHTVEVEESVGKALPSFASAAFCVP